MSKKTLLLIAIAALAFASASSAGAGQRDNSIVQLSVAPIAALADDRRSASDIVPADLGTPSAGNGEQHIAKTGLFSKIKKAAKTVGGAVKTAAKKVGGAVNRATTTVTGVPRKIAGAIAKGVSKVVGTVKKVIKNCTWTSCRVGGTR